MKYLKKVAKAKRFFFEVLLKRFIKILAHPDSIANDRLLSLFQIK